MGWRFTPIPVSGYGAGSSIPPSRAERDFEREGAERVEVERDRDLGRIRVDKGSGVWIYYLADSLVV